MMNFRGKNGEIPGKLHLFKNISFVLAIVFKIISDTESATRENLFFLNMQKIFNREQIKSNRVPTEEFLAIKLDHLSILKTSSRERERERG